MKSNSSARCAVVASHLHPKKRRDRPCAAKARLQQNAAAAQDALGRPRSSAAPSGFSHFAAPSGGGACDPAARGAVMDSAVEEAAAAAGDDEVELPVLELEQLCAQWPAY